MKLNRILTPIGAVALLALTSCGGDDGPSAPGIREAGGDELTLIYDCDDGDHLALFPDGTWQLDGGDRQPAETYDHAWDVCKGYAK